MLEALQAVDGDSPSYKVILGKSSYLEKKNSVSVSFCLKTGTVYSKSHPVNNFYLGHTWVAFVSALSRFEKSIMHQNVSIFTQVMGEGHLICPYAFWSASEVYFTLRVL